MLIVLYEFIFKYLLKLILASIIYNFLYSSDILKKYFSKLCMLYSLPSIYKHTFGMTLLGVLSKIIFLFVFFLHFVCLSIENWFFITYLMNIFIVYNIEHFWNAGKLFTFLTLQSIFTYIESVAFFFNFLSFKLHSELRKALT